MVIQNSLQLLNELSEIENKIKFIESKLLDERIKLDQEELINILHSYLER